MDAWRCEVSYILQSIDDFNKAELVFCELSDNAKCTELALERKKKMLFYVVT